MKRIVHSKASNSILNVSRKLQFVHGKATVYPLIASRAYLRIAWIVREIQGITIAAEHSEHPTGRHGVT